ncbi:MAG: hypothetical protein WCP85_01620 [Mariniphaga sp.]
MKIADFANFIREIPYEYQSFDIKRSIWGNEVNQRMIINDIFSGNETICISRFDLFHSAWNLQEFAIKVLMWGYPTKGRGRNIENLLKPENFEKLICQLKMLEGKNDLTLADIQEFQEIKGLGMSTITKFLYFKKVRIEKYPALIFDQKVLNALNNGKYRDFAIEKFKNIKSNNSVFDYLDYLSFMQSLANKMNVLPDQLELFLFEFGSNLKQPKGEEGDWDLM